MTELNLISMNCINPRYCSYTNGFIDGYAIGVCGLVVFVVLYEIMIIINNMYRPDIDEEKND